MDRPRRNGSCDSKASPAPGRPLNVDPLVVAMKGLAAILVVTLCAVVLLHCSPATQRGSSTRPVPPSTQPADVSDVESVEVCPPGRRWFLTIGADGSASIQYGSTAGDSASLPKGTFDFKAVVAEVLRQQSAAPVLDTTHAHAGLKMKDKNQIEFHPLKDDTYFRDLVASASGKWQDEGWRFDELREKYPIFPHPSAADH